EDEDLDNKPPTLGAGVEQDAQGKPVWQPVVDSGRTLMESTSLLLKRLDVPGLKLEEDVTETKDLGKKPPTVGTGVEQDAHGKPVWQRVVDSGRTLMESTSLLLKRLDVPGLKLEDDVSTPKTPAAKPRAKPEPTASGGYDPYGHNRATPVKKPVAIPQPRRSWWQRLFRRD
ncbi:MAG TPA: hypothetical protein VGN77_05965, partial [Steroidobacteraceae bacterium]|nr:hypothetical protein [Steroidobacteraceae bacterium]